MFGKSKKQPTAMDKTKVHISPERAERIAEKEEEKERRKAERSREYSDNFSNDREASSYISDDGDDFEYGEDNVNNENVGNNNSDSKRKPPKKNFKVLKKKSNGLFKFGIIIVIVLALFLFVNALTPTGIIEYTKVVFSGFGGGDGFPVNISASSADSIAMVGSDAVLLTDSSVVMYKSNGKVIFNRQHGFKNPGMSTSSIRVLSFDRGGKKLRVDNRSELLFEQETESEIITADMGYDGTYAVVTKGNSGYSECVSVYDKNGEGLYIWKTSERRIVTVTVSDDGDYMAVGGIKVENGIMSSDVLLFDMDSTEPICTKTYKGSAVISVDWKDSEVVAVFDNMLSSIDKKGNNTDVSFDTNQLMCYVNNEDGVGVVLCKYNDTTNNVMMALDEELQKLGEAAIDRECLSMTWDSGTIKVLEKERLEEFDTDGEKEAEYKVSANMKKAVSHGSFTLMLGISTLETPEK